MLTVIRCRSASRLYDLLWGLQPRSTPLLGAVLGEGPRAAWKAHEVQDRDGQVHGVLVQHRWMVGCWTAHPLVLGSSAASVLGHLIDRSGAADLVGFSSDTQAVRPFVTRWRAATPVTAASLPPGFSWVDPPDTTRPAEPKDLPTLLDLAWQHGPHSIPSRRLLGRRLRASIDGHTVVVEAGHPARVVGYAARESSTPDYDLWGHVVVAPTFRGLGLAWALTAAAAATTRERGAGALTLVLPGNPMSVPADATMPDAFEYVWLSPPRRFRGEPRVRKAVSRLRDRR